MNNDAPAQTNFIKQNATMVGFDACGVAKAETLTADARFLRQWLDAGKHAEMGYMERNFQKRTDPTLLVPGCKSVIVVLMNYFYQEENGEFDMAKIGKYAIGSTDYHIVMKQKLAMLKSRIKDKYGAACFNESAQHFFTDSAPVLERRWAERAGLGWIGKNKMLISPIYGSFVFIGILLINMELEYDTPVPNRCGKCRKCLDACPTLALSETSGLDAERCISYQTIEKKGAISFGLQKSLSGYMFGCDICQDICPWNKKKATSTAHKEFYRHHSLSLLRTDAIGTLTRSQFKDKFNQTAFVRTGLQKLKENYHYVQENKKSDN